MRIAQLVVITGGGGGIMEAGNRGAADMAVSSAVISPCLSSSTPIPTSPRTEFSAPYFSSAKAFLKRAKVLSCFPGGFGTMDELFEALTLVQTHKIPPMPILLFGKEFWEELIHWDTFVERGLICPDDLKLFRYCETAQEGWEAIKDFYSL